MDRQSATFLERLSQWAPIRLICYVAAIMAIAVIAKILTHLFVPPLPSPLHAPLMVARNLLLAMVMFAVYAAGISRKAMFSVPRFRVAANHTAFSRHQFQGQTYSPAEASVLRPQSCR